MRRIRIMSLLLFVCSTVIFGIYRLEQWKNRDTVGPQITMEPQRLEVSSAATEEELLQGITAYDVKDGDVTDSLMIEQFSNFIEKGRREITVAAFDSDNHISRMKREIVYTDYHSPRFYLKRGLRFPLESQDILSAFGVTDSLDGDISSKIQMSQDYRVVVDRVGEYPVLIQVTNSAGEVAGVKATVEIYDPKEEGKKPAIMLNDYLVYADRGSQINPWDYVESIRLNGREFMREEDGVLRNHDYDSQAAQDLQVRTAITEAEVAVEGIVDYNTPGFYEIVFTFEANESEAGSVRLVVVVSE